MTNSIIYQEQVSSTRTFLLFLVLTLIFFLLFIWRLSAVCLDFLACLLLTFSIMFLFYLVNYRTLLIRITNKSLMLIFGIFHMSIPLENISDFRLDELPPLLKYGGAGIHFMTVYNRYRISFNFLEYSRVVITLDRKLGLVQDVSFSTRQPDQVLQHIHQAILSRSAV